MDLLHAEFMVRAESPTASSIFSATIALTCPSRYRSSWTGSGYSTWHACLIDQPTGFGLVTCTPDCNLLKRVPSLNPSR